MAEYIDREALIAEYDRVHIGAPGGARKLMVDAPAADVEEVKHGHWIKQNIYGEQAWYCSECKTLGSPHWKRCPVCEAKMDGGKENADN